MDDYEDEVMRELGARREAFARRFDGDIRAMLRHVRDNAVADGRPVVREPLPRVAWASPESDTVSPPPTIDRPADEPRA